MDMVKGFTVHLTTADGKAACGVLRVKRFLNYTGLTKDARRVTCAKCEAIAKAIANFEVK